MMSSNILQEFLAVHPVIAKAKMKKKQAEMHHQEEGEGPEDKVQRWLFSLCGSHCHTFPVCELCTVCDAV